MLGLNKFYMTDRAPLSSGLLTQKMGGKAELAGRVRHFPKTLTETQPPFYSHLPLAALILQNWMLKTELVLCTKCKRFTARVFIARPLPTFVHCNSSQTFWLQDPFTLFIKKMLLMKAFTDSSYHIRNETSRAPPLRAHPILLEDTCSAPSTHP